VNAGQEEFYRRVYEDLFRHKILLYVTDILEEKSFWKLGTLSSLEWITNFYHNGKCLFVFRHNTTICLKISDVSGKRTSCIFYQTVVINIPEGYRRHNHSRENLTSFSLQRSKFPANETSLELATSIPPSHNFSPILLLPPTFRSLKCSDFPNKICKLIFHLRHAHNYISSASSTLF
jgi:hypothetical protein